MCDLIDLNSSDTKGLLSAKLASPLIPVPTDVELNNVNTRKESDTLMIEKRNSLDNNPFDMVLHETTEYIRKRDDPFEIVLEKALKSKSKKAIRCNSIDFANDLTPKNKKTVGTKRLNRTLDESLIDKLVLAKDTSYARAAEESIIQDLDNTNLLSDDPVSTARKIPEINIHADLSILNQSIMNDTLSETNDTKAEKSTVFNTYLKPPKLRRSVSQTDKPSPKKLHIRRRSQSILDSLKTDLDHMNSIISNVPSSTSDDPLNEGFFKSLSSKASVFSSLSSVSDITKLSSVSSITTMSNSTINRAFINSCTLEKSNNERTDSVIEHTSHPVSISSVSSVLNTPIKCRFEISDLANRLQKLKATSDERDNERDNNPKTVAEDADQLKDGIIKIHNKHNINDRLIDIDIFVPETGFEKGCTESSASFDTSSDSVFTEANKINKLIVQESKMLAKTFEDLAEKSSSGSSTDDLINSNPFWISQLLPAFEDDGVVDNLIELPASPVTNDINVKLNNQPKELKLITKKVEDPIKNLEIEFVQPVSIETKVTAATLLLDLKKLVKTESNSEVLKLLENLEKALGIECKNNAELLNAYLHGTNNLNKSPQKCDNLDIIENVKVENMEKSQEENTNVASTENIKELYDNVNLNNLSTNKQHSKNEKSLIQTSDKLDNISTNKTSVDEFSTSDSCSKMSGSVNDSNKSDEKMAVELLVNLGKLLSGQTEEPETLNLLKNLGKVLNSVPSNYKPSTDRLSDNKTEQKSTPVRNKLKRENKRHSPLLSKSMNRLSLDLEKTKPSTEKIHRRSISITQTPPSKITNTPVSKHKDAFQLKEIKKRFPSDPGLIGSLTNKQESQTGNVHLKNSCNTRTDIQSKSIKILDAKDSKASMIIGAVKNKLKKKSEADVTSKKGPMKAVLPLKNMQRRASLCKKVGPSTESVTPPKSPRNPPSAFTVISSTPNSISGETKPKKSPKSKPVASSTPDAQSGKIPLHTTRSIKKRNFSCDISPVTTDLNTSKDNNELKDSPKRTCKLPTPRKMTPKRETDSSIPKYFISPGVKNQYKHTSDLTQAGPKKTFDSQKGSPIAVKRNTDKMQSPLKDNNKINFKVKPINLISKLRRHSNGNVMDKENNYS